ncbi:protein mono-ADP-ribosyltransferase PARP14-like [Sphaeramia orbicularis]|uniref:protein mono-ADP-ribosyltransferase PARP14-like n=1 Tax=Sphaeramia orbicularis TaxID=375764 RepID=UPI00117BFBEA|nr:protein mono-ADP-ribosyltransferase PARP14-like [Sphaeramia orbicularis]
MADLYPYPVFIDCTKTLDQEQKKKIENYFKIQRRSGGGDCSSVTNISGTVYKIAFRDLQAQQRVLQRSEHVLTIGGCSLTLTVREGPEPHRSSSVTTSTASSTPDYTTTPQHHSIPVPNPASSGEHHVKLEPYLIRYLKDCPQAGEELSKELSTLGCRAELYPEDGKVCVRSLVQPSASEQVKKWEDEVDNLFKRIDKQYHRHFEVEPSKITIFLQSCNACPTADGVKVYSEVGMAVVVGEHSQVNARLKHMMDSHVKVRGSSLSEKHTRTRRLGEAKLRLLWKEIVSSVQRDFPGVKVTHGEAGQLVLEGSAEEILKAGDLIAVIESVVSERTVSDMSQNLLDLLRTAYGGPGNLRDFLGCGDQVELELKPRDLWLYSQSADKINQTLKELQDKFKEVKINVPNCSDVPSELREKLKSKVNEMNQTGCRVQVLFGSDSMVHLLGHTKEVQELYEVITLFILDQARIEGNIVLPFPELGQKLPELLQQHGFDHSGVTLHLSYTSSAAIVVLEGPSNRVTQVRSRLGPFLDSLRHEKISIDMPGAVRYFRSPSGRDALLKASRDYKCVVQLEENIAGLNLSSLREGTVVASYSLRGGLQVLVCQGDITKLEADVLVNAANEDLDHCGGVAAALSKAGGPQVQKESSRLVQQKGKIRTGEVVMTTGGNLKCKALLHAIGPVQGDVGGREKVLIEQSVKKALDLAETKKFRSIAIPCISSGVFGVPVRDSAEAMVTAVMKFGSQGGRSLNRVMLIDNRGEVVRSMQDTCDRLLQGISTGSSVPRDVERVRVEVIQGTIETQQVDSLVSPMVGHDPVSTRVGQAFSNVVGPQMTGKFHTEARGGTLTGDTVLVHGLPGLQSKAVFFLNLIQWDKKQNGTAVQALKRGISQILVSCENKGFRSVGFPVLGTGALLRFPHVVASRVLMEAIRDFEQNRTSTTPFLVRVVVHPNDKDSRKAFQSAQQTFHLKGFTNNANPDQASFYRYVSASNDEVTAMLGGVKLQMVRGDITHERTDVIVNTTDFSNNQSGVSQAILTAAGPTVQAELRQIGTPTDRTCVTGAGLLGCNEIFHASFHCDPQKINKNCKKILKHCESKGYTSVAFPAVNTGMGGMDSAAACKAMLDGMASAIIDLNPNSTLSVIRIVILQQPIFQVFRSELENRFGQMAPTHNLAEKILKHVRRTSKLSSMLPNILSSKPQPVIISVICCSSDIIRTIKTALEANLQQLLVKREVDMRDFSRLDAMELAAVLTNIRILGISLQERERQSANGNMAASGARARSGSTEVVYVLKGLKEDVLSITELVNKALQKALQEQEEENLSLTVQWFIQGQQEKWKEFSLHENYLLEDAYAIQQVSVDVKEPDGMEVTVNLRTMEATNWVTGITYKVKRILTNITLELPEHWDPMEGEDFKKVELNPNSKEYKEIAQGFLKTAKYNIQKIERIQNLHLWRAFAVCRQRILAKNGVAELGEKLLYHGTSAESCNCIERDKFDRGYAGTHAAAYGKGVYFAVTAEYSARGYSPADSTGLKRLYAARVVTGRYTGGNSTLCAPPARGSDPSDRFDSVVDNQQRPNMFIIFHDGQAYPEYLIIFK